MLRIKGRLQVGLLGLTLIGGVCLLHPAFDPGSLPLRDPSPKAAWKLVWSDEFSGPDGSAPDSSKWTYDIGGNGWGNHELEYYTSRRQNVHLEHGMLAIRALRESYTGPGGVHRDYTSARLKTQGLFEQAYGRFEARIKIPYGQGLWPAFWMLGADVGKVGWPRCGEIDIFENIGREPSVIHGSLHGPNFPPQGATGIYTLPNGERFADRFYVFAIEWEPEVVRFYADRHLYKTVRRGDVPVWVFDHPYFILLNVAVGGDWPGDPDATTVFPQTMLVDYVRVYRR